ncbi:hypothetical protein HDU93_009305 [Gonapodya sp. JEL0774]|nr:hypothetical protein HDU93_009305 [Gonapodya sp. JEL0774]
MEADPATTIDEVKDRSDRSLECYRFTLEELYKTQENLVRDLQNLEQLLKSRSPDYLVPVSLVEQITTGRERTEMLRIHETLLTKFKTLLDLVLSEDGVKSRDFIDRALEEATTATLKTTDFEHHLDYCSFVRLALDVISREEQRGDSSVVTSVKTVYI